MTTADESGTGTAHETGTDPLATGRTVTQQPIARDHAETSVPLTFLHDHGQGKTDFIGDTLTVTYTVDERDDTNGTIRSDVKAVNQHGEVATVATHILKAV